jgi:hypothetical protein
VVGTPWEFCPMETDKIGTEICGGCVGGRLGWLWMIDGGIKVMTDGLELPWLEGALVTIVDGDGMDTWTTDMSTDWPWLLDIKEETEREEAAGDRTMTGEDVGCLCEFVDIGSEICVDWTRRDDELEVALLVIGISVTGMAVDPWVESETNGTPGSNEGVTEDTSGVVEELNVESCGIVELIGVFGMLVELTPIAVEMKDVGESVKLAGGGDETDTIDTEMPLGVEIVAEHCEETTLSPQMHWRTLTHSAGKKSKSDASCQ